MNLNSSSDRSTEFVESMQNPDQMRESILMKLLGAKSSPGHVMHFFNRYFPNRIASDGAMEEFLTLDANMFTQPTDVFSDILGGEGVKYLKTMQRNVQVLQFLLERHKEASKILEGKSGNFGSYKELLTSDFLLETCKICPNLLVPREKTFEEDLKAIFKSDGIFFCGEKVIRASNGDLLMVSIYSTLLSFSSGNYTFVHRYKPVVRGALKVTGSDRNDQNRCSVPVDQVLGILFDVEFRSTVDNMRKSDGSSFQNIFTLPIYIPVSDFREVLCDAQDGPVTIDSNKLLQYLKSTNSSSNPCFKDGASVEVLNCPTITITLDKINQELIFLKGSESPKHSVYACFDGTNKSAVR